MGQNLTGQLISATYEGLVQISGSILTDGTGSNINNLTVTASLATTATSASFASTATSASFASTSTSASFATTATSASFATNATTATSASFATTATSASQANNSNTATSASFATTSISASQAGNANTATSASFATTSVSASYALTSTSASHAVNANASLTTTSASYASTSTSASHALIADFASSATSASFATTALLATSASHANNADASISASFASTIANNLSVTFNSITASGANFTDLYATSASFGSITTRTGSAVIIGDAFIVLNADTPTLPFAGIIVYDTGSAATASLEWNGNNDYWITVEETGQSSVILTGISGSKGTETLPALNKLLKGQGNNTVADSTITDNGTLVTIDASVSASGYVSSSQFVGNLTGTATNATSASYATTATSASFASTATSATTASYVENAVSSSYSAFALSASYSSTATSASHALNADSSTSASYATNALSASFAPSTPAFPFTGSAQITGSLGVTGSATVSGTGIFGLVGGGLGIQVSDTIAISGPALFADQRIMDATSSFSPYTSSYSLRGGVGPASTLSLQGSTGNAEIFITKESLTITGSALGEVKALSISSLTSSLDCLAGNFYTLTLVDGANTFVNPSNIAPGQTINLSIANGATGTGTVSFATSVLQTSGSVYTATTGSNVLDVVTLISFDGTNLLLSAVKNFV